MTIRAYRQCPYCEQLYPAFRRQDHCGGAKCLHEHVRLRALAEVEPNGECLDWMGKFRRRHDYSKPTAYVAGREWEGDRPIRKDFRVLQLRDPNPDLADSRVYDNLCGNLKCVNIEHHKVRVAKISMQINARLPAQPLLDALERYKGSRDGRALKNYAESVRRARETGTVAVSTADNICIDVLGVHPANLYGDLFFTA